MSSVQPLPSGSPAMRILYMNSFSRSGETLMLRTLHAHREICALHQLLRAQDETEHQYNVFKRVRASTPEAIALSDEESRAIDARGKPVLVVKNAIFEIDHPHYGFILVRNPFSAYASYRKLAGALENPRSQMRRWAQNIDHALVPVVDYGDFLEAFCALYARKMGSLLGRGLPVVHYEAFVAEPEKTLRGLLAALGLEWDGNVLKAHAAYPAGKKGHGGMDLSAPIALNNSHALPDLGALERDRIYSYVSGVARQYGYRFDFANRRLEIAPAAGARP